MTFTSKLDPRTKLFLIACLSSSAVIMSHWTFLAVLFGISVLLLLLFGVNPWGMLKKCKLLLYMVLGIAILQSIFMPAGQAIITVGSLKLLSLGGLKMAGEFILRMLIIIASAGILSTSSSREIIQGLVQCKLPYEVALMASLGIRFLPVFAEEFRDTMIAIQLRGVDFKTLPFKQKIEVMGSLFQPVVAGAIIKSKALAMSIEMRGFRASPHRSSYLVLKCRIRDYVIMISCGILTALMMFCYFSI
ncbi:MAG: energy-coupling factor transporter transmembrane component T [Syntrophomonadaceae bacterium]|nr:energy-coupling factor transporter transmembrane component T [Syntrophomonadaceae bacterium]